MKLYSRVLREDGRMDGCKFCESCKHLHFDYGYKYPYYCSGHRKTIVAFEPFDNTECEYYAQVKTQTSETC